MSGSAACPYNSPYTTTMFALEQNKNQPQLQVYNTTKIENPKCFTSTFTTSHISSSTSCNFQMPLHYPRYKKSDYETMPVEKLDCLLKQYGLPVIGDVNHKRKFAMGAFLWPSQNT
ncbi:uncharacterized protein LOC132069486 [Lycium ferocissimum]|uniref:uncharacterized protein LOC132069486 n=1 Tax=Lycium ferocissimum TaxID=112874 RepID=UPI002815270B|nr:uncharacterized protein LOC132069486 [Lycium ferocissimum]